MSKLLRQMMNMIRSLFGFSKLEQDDQPNTFDETSLGYTPEDLESYEQSHQPPVVEISEEELEAAYLRYNEKLARESELANAEYEAHLEAEARQAEADERAYREYQDGLETAQEFDDSDSDEEEEDYEPEYDDRDADDDYPYDDFSDEDDETDEDYEADLREALFLQSEHCPDNQWRYDHMGNNPLPLGDEPKKKEDLPPEK